MSNRAFFPSNDVEMDSEEKPTPIRRTKLFFSEDNDLDSVSSGGSESSQSTTAEFVAEHKSSFSLPTHTNPWTKSEFLSVPQFSPHSTASLRLHKRSAARHDDSDHPLASPLKRLSIRKSLKSELSNASTQPKVSPMALFFDSEPAHHATPAPVAVLNPFIPSPLFISDHSVNMSSIETTPLSASGESQPTPSGLSVSVTSPLINSPTSPASPSSLTISTPHSETSTSKRFFVPTPDLAAFESKPTIKSLTPRNVMPRCPSPPRNLKPMAITRKSSIWDTKDLFSVTHNGDDCFLDKFDILETLGEGSFFVVLKARKKNDGQIYALKKSKNLFRGKSDRTRYLQEISAAPLQVPHPNIVTYHRAWQQDGHFYLQLEYCECNLNDYCTSQFQGKVPPPFLWKCAIEIAKGLLHVHANNVLHLDIKPANILISSEGVLKIGDFGQAISGKWTDGAEGDSQYMAPELLDPEVAPESAADMFSLGILLFELATDINLPTEGPLWHDLREGRILNYLGGVADQDMVDLIVCLTHPNPRKRISARELLEKYKNKYGGACFRYRPPPSAALTRRGSIVNLQPQFLATCDEDSVKL